MKLKSTLICGCAVSALMASAYENKTESRAYFATNPANGVGKAATITIDGKLDDWSEDMMIARNGANNMSTAFKGTHENNVIDIYAIYAAWDDQNLYVAWQMCNTGDTWAAGRRPPHRLWQTGRYPVYRGSKRRPLFAGYDRKAGGRQMRMGRRCGNGHYV